MAKSGADFSAESLTQPRIALRSIRATAAAFLIKP